MAGPTQTSASDRSAGAATAATKMHVPQPRSGAVPRERLVAAIRSSPEARLTLIDAPVGSGKTTLLSEWHASPAEPRPFAWLSLDPADNDPVRFFDCVIQSLQTVAPGAGSEAVSKLGLHSLTAVVLPSLINDLHRHGPAVVLVLDDYHVISDAEVHAAVTFLLEHLPPNLHIAIATRSDPPLPLGRLRVRGEITEIRAADLRFTENEAAAFFAGALPEPIAPNDIARLQSRTEGWAAGLQLAALSLRGRDDAHDFISSFAGDDRQIVDYLGFEVLDGQPEETRAFLLQTSVLERMCGSLCDAVTQRAGGAATLEALDRANLFVVPLDSRREWYRYHHLFRELLRHELHRDDPRAADELHRRASAWHRERGLVPEAIHHSGAARDHARTSKLITAHWYGFLQQGRLQTVVRWLDALGEDNVAADPNLCLVRAWVGVNTGSLDDTAHWIGAAERAVDGRAGDDADVVTSGVASLRAIHQYMSGNVAEAVEAGRRSLELVPGRTPWRPVGCPVLGISLFWSGHSDEARAELAAAVKLAESDQNHLARVHALGGLAAIAAGRGDYEETAKLAALSTRVAAEQGLSEHWATTLARVSQGEVLTRSGRIDEACRTIDAGVELSRRGLASLEQAYALLRDAEARHARGDGTPARERVAEARRAVERCADPGILNALVAGAERRTRAGGSGANGSNGHGEISARELTVLRLLPSGMSQREIGAALFVSLNTVKTHVKSIYRKLDAGDRAEAVARARELDLI